MKKTKILSTMIFALAIAFMCTTTVFASNARYSQPYYTNLNGVELTQQQYNNLARVFDEDTIATLTQDMADILADDTTLQTRSSTQYVKVETVVDIFGNEVSYSEEEVTEEEALEFEANPPMQTRGYPTHQTAMKKLQINITVGSISVKTITVTCTWLSGQMPVTRSHDVLAVRPNKSFTFNTGAYFSAYLKHNGNTVQTYNKSSGNVVNSSAGVGVSMPLPTGGTSMSHGLTLIVISGADPFDAYGSFQHAQSTVSLADSKKYSLVVNGRTNIIKFNNSTIAGKYDNMQSVDCTWRTSTLSCN
jgi:hypothetical protein